MVTIWPLSPEPALMLVTQLLTDCAAASSFTARLLTLNDGALLTKVCVTRMVRSSTSDTLTPPLSVPPSSTRRTEISTVPVVLPGEKRSVPVESMSMPVVEATPAPTSTKGFNRFPFR